MSSAGKTIYCISGLGADENVFAQLHIANHSLQYLHWIKPQTRESLSSYALRLSHQIPESEPVVLGLSFGGMLAIEMAKQIPVKKVILVSSVKTFREIPKWMRWAGTLQLNKWIPIKTNRLTEKADDRRMGIETAEEKAFVEHYRNKADQQQVNWAVNQIINWKNTWVPNGIYHIHGEKDRMFPIKNIQPTHVIKDGTHIMILNRTREIGQCIEEILAR